jgi:hypothetical protein
MLGIIVPGGRDFVVSSVGEEVARGLARSSNTFTSFESVDRVADDVGSDGVNVGAGAIAVDD